MVSYISIIISGITLLFSLYVFSQNNTKQDTTELTTVIVKLESIGSGITDIKAEISALRDDQKDDHDKLIKLEYSINTAWKRIDELRACVCPHEVVN